jgi:hypothetical protein
VAEENNEQRTGGPTGPEGGEAPPQSQEPPQSEEELRRRLEEEVRNLRVEDVLLQSVVSIVNLTARRLGKADERDLGQARTGIEAVRALVEILPEEPRAQIRNALSELQMLYAREAGGAQAPPTGEAEARERPPGEPSPAPGGRRGPSKLWTPPGSG